MSEVDWRITDDGKMARIIFPEKIRSISFDAAGAEQFILDLGNARSRMSPGVPDTFPQSKQVLAPSSPRWQAGLAPAGDHIFFRVRDPRFGWLSYAFTREGTHQLAAALMSLATAPTD